MLRETLVLRSPVEVAALTALETPVGAVVAALAGAASSRVPAVAAAAAVPIRRVRIFDMGPVCPPCRHGKRIWAPM